MTHTDEKPPSSAASAFASVRSNISTSGAPAWRNPGIWKPNVVMPGTLSRFPAKLFGGKSAPRTVFAPNCLLGAALLVREQLVHDERQPSQLSTAYGLDLDD